MKFSTNEVQNRKKIEFISRVKILLSGDWDDVEMEQLFQEIDENVPCPYAEIQGFIFHSEGMTAEEVKKRGHS